MTKQFKINHFSQDLINTIASTVNGGKSVRRRKQILYAGPCFLVILVFCIAVQYRICYRFYNYFLKIEC